MPADVQISFRGMDPSPSVEMQVQHRAADLQQLSDRVTACRVTLEAAHRRHRQGTIYHACRSRSAWRQDRGQPGAVRGPRARGHARRRSRRIRCRAPPAAGSYPPPRRQMSRLARRDYDYCVGPADEEADLRSLSLNDIETISGDPSRTFAR
jgi:hypothetical protein